MLQTRQSGNLPFNFGGMIREVPPFCRTADRPTLRGPHLDNLTFNFKGATRRSAPFRFTSPCLKCGPLAVRPQPAALPCSGCGSHWGRSLCAGSLGHSFRQEAGARQPVLIALKIAPFSGEDGAIGLLGLCCQVYAKRATSSCRTSVILTSELTGTNSLTPW